VRLYRESTAQGHAYILVLDCVSVIERRDSSRDLIVHCTRSYFSAGTSGSLYYNCEWHSIENKSIDSRKPTAARADFESARYFVFETISLPLPTIVGRYTISNAISANHPYIAKTRNVKIIDIRANYNNIIIPSILRYIIYNIVCVWRELFVYVFRDDDDDRRP